MTRSVWNSPKQRQVFRIQFICNGNVTLDCLEFPNESKCRSRVVLTWNVIERARLGRICRSSEMVRFGFDTSRKWSGCLGDASQVPNASTDRVLSTTPERTVFPVTLRHRLAAIGAEWDAFHDVLVLEYPSMRSGPVGHSHFPRCSPIESGVPTLALRLGVVCNALASHLRVTAD